LIGKSNRLFDDHLIVILYIASYIIAYESGI